MDKWEEGRKSHLALSAAAAERYDELYETANFATGSYMKYELETIEKYVKQIPNPELAVDLGCGTGRDSFLIARHFSQVYAYDFSQEMIRVANKNKINKHAGNVLFETRDIEDGPLPLRNEIVSFVNTAFGMGSFVKTPETLFREIRRIIEPRGIAIFSFYNLSALVNQLQLDWRPALAARVLPGEDALEVDFENNIYRISAKAYMPQDIRNKLSGNFKVLEVTTFPTLSALFPQQLFKNDLAKRLCTQVDQLLSTNLEIAAGPYIVAVCQKGGSIQKLAPIVGYERVLELLRFHDVAEDIREHQPVRTMNDVFEVLQDTHDKMVKSILVTYEQEQEQDIRDAELFLIGIPASRRLDMGKVAKFTGRQRANLRFANQIEVEKVTGFKVGSIPPFGLPKRIPVIIDSAIMTHEYVWCGTGKATESLRVSIDNLRKLSACTVADVSKPE